MEARPDIKAVFTDVHMPGTRDGLALARYVREVCRDCAIVVVSGRGVPRLRELEQKTRYFDEPYRPDAVVEAVREMLDI